MYTISLSRDPFFGIAYHVDSGAIAVSLLFAFWSIEYINCMYMRVLAVTWFCRWTPKLNAKSKTSTLSAWWRRPKKTSSGYVLMGCSTSAFPIVGWGFFMWRLWSRASIPVRGIFVDDLSLILALCFWTQIGCDEKWELTAFVWRVRRLLFVSFAESKHIGTYERICCCHPKRNACDCLDLVVYESRLSACCPT